MSFLDKITAFLPLGKKEEKTEYFFAVNIESETISAALWCIESKELKILSTASENYSQEDDIAAGIDKLLDTVVGLREIEPQKILFGVPNQWILEDSLKDEDLKILRNIVKELELAPMAYVAEGNALIHFLEKQESVPPTAILAGFEKHYLTVAVVRAGKLDGVKVLKRAQSAGADIEKALLQFAEIETLPSKILIYGKEANALKSELLSFSWMSKLSFLHFPKIDVLEEEIGIKSICLAGASEINSNISYSDQPIKKQPEGVKVLNEDTLETAEKEPESERDLGFVVGDISEKQVIEKPQVVEKEAPLEIEDFKEENLPVSATPDFQKKKFNIKDFVPAKFRFSLLVVILPGILFAILGAYIFFAKAEVKVFVEPKVIEKDAQIVADPNQKTVNENEKIIPGQIVETEVSGSAKDTATGKRQIGDPAKGTVVVYNKTSESQTLSKGTQFAGQGGLKFTLDNSVTIASQSASDSGITFGKGNARVTAWAIGPDGNLPSGSTFTLAGFASDKVTAKAEGNFSGGTSKDVTVISSDDAARLLAKLSSDLKQQAQQKLQEKYPSKKIIKEALAESIVKKSYNKNINDPAGEFSLTLSAAYKGTAFDDADLKSIISKLVTTDVPEGFKLDLTGTETLADVSSLEKNGKLIFSAKFKAKLLPKIDQDEIKNKIKFKSQKDAGNIIKSMENVLGAEIKIFPKLPSFLARTPLLSRNIRVEAGLK